MLAYCCSAFLACGPALGRLLISPLFNLPFMIHYIKGRLVEKSPVHAVVDCNGMAYFLHISLGTFGKLGDNENITMFTHFNINSNDFSLNMFGFADEAERDVFRKLISVSGVGPNTARMVLSGLSTEEVKQMIMLRDVAGFKRIKGIGEKTAERIIIDLHDKVAKTGDILIEKVGVPHNIQKQEALAALTLLGLDKTKSEKLIDKIMVMQPGIALEDLIKQVLKQL
jgi:Holliday junction DNA helicase RuvA